MNVNHRGGRGGRILVPVAHGPFRGSCWGEGRKSTERSRTRYSASLSSLDCTARQAGSGRCTKRIGAKSQSKPPASPPPPKRNGLIWPSSASPGIGRPIPQRKGRCILLATPFAKVRKAAGGKREHARLTEDPFPDRWIGGGGGRALLLCPGAQWCSIPKERSLSFGVFFTFLGKRQSCKRRKSCQNPAAPSRGGEQYLCGSPRRRWA